MDREHAKNNMKENEQWLDAIRGCLIGGAAGDALGYPVEFRKAKDIEITYGENGIQNYELFHGKAYISDDTQMTLFTATGLLLGMTRGMNRGVMGSLGSYPGFAYKTWYLMQIGKNPRDEYDYAYSWLADVPEMGASRSPGYTCMSVIESGNYGTVDNPINDSKGCGGIMRVAPVGLYLNREPSENDRVRELDETAAEVAALTHGHELGYMPAAALAHIINRLVYSEMTLLEATRDSIKYLKCIYAGKNHLDELISIIEKAIELSANLEKDADNIKQVGEGWVAEETLAIAIYCSLRYKDDFSKALSVSVNHNGDSDSTGAVTGNILGAVWGYEKIPDKWKQDLECHDIILEVADDLCHDCQMTEYGSYFDPAWEAKYIQNRRYVPQVNVCVKKADITKLEVDAIVNAANNSLLGRGGVDGAIHRAAGPELLKECRSLNGCATGEVKVTKGYHLPATYVIHTVGPIWNGGDKNEAEYLENCWRKSLEAAVSMGIHSMAFPSISTGVYGYPLEKAAKIAMQVTVKFLRNNPNSNLKVIIAAFDDRTMVSYKEALKCELEK